jgi:hypothetical protein
VVDAPRSSASPSSSRDSRRICPVGSTGPGPAAPASRFSWPGTGRCVSVSSPTATTARTRSRVRTPGSRVQRGRSASTCSPRPPRRLGTDALPVALLRRDPQDSSLVCANMLARKGFGILFSASEASLAFLKGTRLVVDDARNPGVARLDEPRFSLLARTRGPLHALGCFPSSLVNPQKSARRPWTH